MSDYFIISVVDTAKLESRARGLHPTAFLKNGETLR
jgi:hypothetical protein